MEQQQQQGMDARYLLQTVLNGRWIILAVTLLAAAAALVSNYFQPLHYRAWAQVQIDAPPYLPTPGSDLSAQTSYYSNVDRYFKTEKERLNSRRMRLLFTETIRKSDPAAPALVPEAIVKALEEGLTVEPVEDTNILSVYFTTDEAVKSAAWLNTYIDLFVKENARVQEENVKQNRKALDQQLDEIKKMLAAQQEQMRQYVEAPGNAGTQTVAADPDFLFRYQATFEDAHRKRLEEEQRLSKLEPFLSPTADLSSIPNFDFSAALRGYYDRMLDAQSALEKLRLGGKGEEHPSVVARKKDVQTLQDQVRAELKKGVDSIKLNISVLKQAEDTALKSYREKLAERKVTSQKQQDIVSLEKLRETWTGASTLIEEKLRSLKVLESFVVNNISVVERAVPDPKPVARRGVLFVVLCGFGGTILGIGIVMAGDFVHPKIKTVEEIQSTLNVPALGFLPRARDFSLNEIKESYNALRTEVLFRRDMHRQRTLMITSSIPQEGKTTVTLNLAKTLAAAGDRTLVLDFDLRKARLRSILGRPDQAPENVFTPVQGLTLRLEATEIPNLHLIVPVKLPDQAPYVLSQPEIKEMIEYLRTRYEWILVDTPPVTSVTDAVILASVVDTILFVIKHNFADKRLIRNSINVLRKTNSNIMGAVLNDLDIRKMGYYAYQGYYRYYTQSEAK
jgi:polysaccharide biosynthesis transport protein